MTTSDIIGVLNVLAQLAVAGVAVWAVIVALKTSNRQIEENKTQQTNQINASNDQLTRQIEESRRSITLLSI